MSRLDRKMSRPPLGEHGTEASYVIGFLLSLCFTIIPYNLVRGHLLTSMTLLVIILVIAAVQMIVQVVFFLHLGRKRKPRWQLYFLCGTVFGILTVVGGSIFIMDHLHHNMSPIDTATLLSQDEGIAQVEGTKTGACQVIHAEHTVTISGGVASPVHTDAHTCDTLVFVTDDNQQRKITFGIFPTETPYAGVTGLPISNGHGNMIILSANGSYNYHDDLDPRLSGSFTVRP